MIMRKSNHHQEDHQQEQQQLEHQQKEQEQKQYHEQHKSTLVIMSMKSQTQSVNLKNKENSTAIMRKQFTPISDISSGSFSSASVAGSIQDDNMSDQCSLTQAGLEEYNSRSYYDPAVFHHQKQSSYAQSEGYHSYVSSSDSSSATPFLDRLRQESELLSRQSHHWSQNDLSATTPTITTPPSSVTTNGNSNAGTVVGGGGEQQSNHHLLRHHHHHHHHHHQHHNSANSNSNNNSSESHSSTETLKWLGSMSDVSEASHATGYSAISGSVSSSQLIVHSSRVLTPKRHHSESVLYMNDDQQLSPTLSVSNSPTNMPPPARTSPCGSTTSSSAIYMSHHPPHYIPQTSPVSSLTKGAVAVSSSSPTLLFPNHTADQLNKSTLSVTISGAPSPNGSAHGIGAAAIVNDSQTLHQSLLSIAPSSPSSLLPSSSPLQKSSSASPTLSMTSLSVVVTSANGLATSSSPSSSSSSFSSNTSAMTTTSSSSYRNNHRLFPVSTYTEPINNTSGSPSSNVHHHHHGHQQAGPQTQPAIHPQQQQHQQQQQHYQPAKLHSPQPTSWQSVADRINDFERQQQHLHHHHHHQANAMQKYTFIDPSKTHRVSNPALKAFQKNAVQSYFERQQQQSKEHLKHGVSGNNLLRPHSFQPTGSTKEVSSSVLIRNSLPNNYGAVPVRKTTHHQLSTDISNDTFPDCGSSPPPPPPPRSRSLMPVRRSSSASEYAEFRDQYHRAATQEKLQSQSIKNVTQPEKMSFNDCGMPPPPPPPRSRASLPVRRTSSASEYAAMREKALLQVANIHQQHLQRQNVVHTMGPILSVDEWVPERPPKNPNLRIPSPDLPPPPPALVTVDIDASLINQDEPLPPPPPEILRQPPMHMLESQKPPSPNRRNSFAGSPSRKAFFNALPPPPSIPKKPTNMDLLHCRPASCMAQQSNKAHKIILNEKLSLPMAGDHKSVMVARKRPHHPAVIPPILENAGTIYNNTTGSSSQQHKSPIRSDGLKSSPPPPLKPRMPTISSQVQQPIAISSKIRCNSKASYLPRQSLEKLNTADPDHGSYKLTLTSNEDCVTHHYNNNNNNNSNSSSNTKSDLLNGGGNKCNNLPDVLPVGVKLQPSSPTSAIGTSPRYGSNNNISPTTPTTPNYPPPPYPNMKMFISKPQLSSNSSRHSSPATAYTNNSNSSGFNRSQSYDATTPKYMSQSTIDLKKTQILESPEELPPSCHIEKILSPAQSESNINSYTPRKEFKEFHRPEVVRKLSLEERDPGEGRIVRAELVNATLSTSEHKITRKDSLRENIEKITQLQSKLMSAHMSDAGERNILGYPPAAVGKPVQSPSPKVEAETQKPEETELPQPPPSPTPPALPSTPLPTELEAISQMEPATDGLKLMQRTEIILRVNPVTNEVGSQTDELLESDVNRLKITDVRDDALQRTTLQPRQKHPIELDCDKLLKELASLLPQNDRLLEILTPQSIKTPTDYVGKLYNPDVPLRPAKRDVGTSTPSEVNGGPRFELQFAEIEVSLTNGGASETGCDHLIRKKEDVIKYLTRKLGILNSEQATIAEESAINDELGRSIAAKVADKMRPIDATKFRTYIDDVGHITSLLLSLSGRLAKAENSLTALCEHSPERKITILKRDRLVEQLEEAKRLKEDINRRGSCVAAVLEKSLTLDEFADYDYFINMKAKLIADSRDIADKIKFSEEQLSALNDALIQSDC